MHKQVPLTPGFKSLPKVIFKYCLDSSDNKFGSRKLRKGSKNQRKGIIDGDGYLKTKVKANLWAYCIKEGIDR